MSYKVILSIAGEYNLFIKQFDTETAFFNVESREWYITLQGAKQSDCMSVKFAARVKRGLQSHEMLSLCFVSSSVYYFS